MYRWQMQLIEGIKLSLSVGITMSLSMWLAVWDPGLLLKVLDYLIHRVINIDLLYTSFRFERDYIKHLDKYLDKYMVEYPVKYLEKYLTSTIEQAKWTS